MSPQSEIREHSNKDALLWFASLEVEPRNMVSSVVMFLAIFSYCNGDVYNAVLLPRNNLISDFLSHFSISLSMSKVHTEEFGCFSSSVFRTVTTELCWGANAYIISYPLPLCPSTLYFSASYLFTVFASSVSMYSLFDHLFYCLSVST